MSFATKDAWNLFKAIKGFLVAYDTSDLKKLHRLVIKIHFSSSVYVIKLLNMNTTNVKTFGDEKI
jgi:hypothetical protein